MTLHDVIPPDDRGFTLGDGLFETLLVVEGEILGFDAHLDRLHAGCEALGLPLPDAGACRRAIIEAAGQTGLARAAARLSYTAGSGGRGLNRPDAPAPRLLVTAAAAPEPGRAVRLLSSDVRRNEGSPASRWKTLAYLDSVLARRQARAAGADEALMLNNRGELACAAAANVFWIVGHSLFTPALDCGALAGTVRAALSERTPVHEVRAGPEALESADAVLLTNALIGVAPVADWDGRRFSPHPRIEALAALVADLVPPAPGA